jgi:hypothetical protein
MIAGVVFLTTLIFVSRSVRQNQVHLIDLDSKIPALSNNDATASSIPTETTASDDFRGTESPVDRGLRREQKPPSLSFIKFTSV